MKTIELEPIREDKSDFDELEALIAHLFRESIYLPLLAELEFKKNLLHNSKEDLISAIQSGRLNFNQGKFYGKLNSTLSRELRKIGAEWDRKHGCFSISQSKLPTDILMAIQISEANFKAKLNRVIDRLKKTVPAKINAEDLFDRMLWRTEKKFKDSIKNITVAPEITPEMRKRISAEYTTNMQLYITDFTEKETIELRQNIEKLMMSGKRYESIIGEIQRSYGVSQRKAKFLARQESNLMTTKYKQTRYESAGIDEYKWRCVNNPKDTHYGEHIPGNVRYFHGLNDGKVFRWDTGAVVNENGERKNPGQDYNCRCIGVPIVRF